jgi:hypothetical protein
MSVCFCFAKEWRQYCHGFFGLKITRYLFDHVIVLAAGEIDKANQ